MGERITVSREVILCVNEDRTSNECDTFLTNSDPVFCMRYPVLCRLGLLTHLLSRNPRWSMTINWSILSKAFSQVSL